MIRVVDTTSSGRAGQHGLVRDCCTDSATTGPGPHGISRSSTRRAECGVERETRLLGKPAAESSGRAPIRFTSSSSPSTAGGRRAWHRGRNQPPCCTRERVSADDHRSAVRSAVDNLYRRIGHGITADVDAKIHSRSFSKPESTPYRLPRPTNQGQVCELALTVSVNVSRQVGTPCGASTRARSNAAGVLMKSRRPRRAEATDMELA